MKRIMPEQVIEAYQQTGLKPIQNSYYRNDCACAFGALYIANGGSRDNSSKVDKFADDFSESRDYSSGFMHGFDGEDLGECINDEFSIGYEDGKRAWDALQESN